MSGVTESRWKQIVMLRKSRATTKFLSDTNLLIPVKFVKQAISYTLTFAKMKKKLYKRFFSIVFKTFFW
jgi:hypothetical protein